MTTKSGSPKFSNSASDGRINMFFTKWACQATSIIKRTFNRVFSLAPQNASTTYNLFPDNWLTVVSFKAFQVFWVIGLLSLTAFSDVHQKVSLLTSSLTIYLSFGDRPVKTPVITFTAPSSVNCPLSKPSKLGLSSSWYKNS